MSSKNSLTVKITLVPTKVIFPKPFKRTPPRQLQPIFIHSIQTQQCGCCSPLVVKTTTNTRDLFKILDIDEETLEFESLFHSLQQLANVMKGQKQLRDSLIDLFGLYGTRISVIQVHEPFDEKLIDTLNHPETFRFRVNFISYLPQRGLQVRVDTCYYNFNLDYTLIFIGQPIPQQSRWIFTAKPETTDYGRLHHKLGNSFALAKDGIEQFFIATMLVNMKQYITEA